MGRSTRCRRWRRRTGPGRPRRRDVLHRGAEVAEGLATETGHAELQPVEVLRPVDLLAEPAARLGARVAGHEGLEVEQLRQLVLKLPAAHVVVPVAELQRGHAEGHRGVEGEPRMLADEVVVGGVVHVGLTRRDGIEGLEGADQLAGGLELDLHLAVGHGVDVVGAALGGVVDAGQSPPPRGDHGQLDPALREGGRGVGRHRGGRHGGGAEGRRREEFAALHVVQSPGC